MKRLMSAGLIDFLQNNRNMEEADLFVIDLPNGETIYATSGQWDVSVPAGIFGWPAPPSLAEFIDNTGTAATAPTFTTPLLAPQTSSDFAVVISNQPLGSPSAPWTNVSGFNYLQLGDNSPWGVTLPVFSSLPWATVSLSFPTTGTVSIMQHISENQDDIYPFVFAQSFVSSVTAGNTIVAFIQNVTGAALSDSLGNEYTKIEASIEGANTTVFVATNIVGGPCTLNWTWESEINGYGSVSQFELSNAGAPPVPPTTFYATKYGRWSRGTITSEASFEMSANTMALTCAPQPATAFPGNPIGVLNAALNGLFDAAQVTVYTAYFPLGQYGTIAGSQPSALASFVLSQAGQPASEGASTASTAGIDTGNASIDLIVIACNNLDSNISELTLSDTINGVTSGNTWVPVTPDPSVSGAAPGVPFFFYCYAPHTGLDHVFTLTSTGSGNPSLVVMAFTGMPSSGSPESDASWFSLNSSNYGPTPSAAVASGVGVQSPATEGDLIIAAAGIAGVPDSAVTVDSGISIEGDVRPFSVAGLTAGYAVAQKSSVPCTGAVTITGSASAQIAVSSSGLFTAPTACSGTVILSGSGQGVAQIFVDNTSGFSIGMVVIPEGFSGTVGTDLNGIEMNVTAVGPTSITVQHYAAFTSDTYTGQAGMLNQVVTASGFSGDVASLNGQASLYVTAVSADSVTVNGTSLSNGTYAGQAGKIGVPINPCWSYSGGAASSAAASIVIFPSVTQTIGPGSLETKFKGAITRIVDINRVHVEFECGDPMYLLNMKVPRRLMQPNCPWSVTDENCTLNAGGVDVNGFNMTQEFTLASGTQYILYPEIPFVQPEGYFSQGVVTCTAGNNAGLSQTVKLHASGELQLLNPWLLPVAPGDTFSVLVGCDHTPTTCTVKFGNLINFGGTPFVPPAESAV